MEVRLMAKRVKVEVTKEPVFYKSAIDTDMDIENISIGNKKAFETLSEDDEEPKFFISTVRLGEDYKTMTWPEVVLTESWAKSFVAAVNKSPGPLYIEGHEDSDFSRQLFRAIPDGYVVGGKVENDTMFLRNYILPGETDIQKALVKQTIREIKAGILSTSTGDIQKHRLEFDENDEPTYYAIESIKNQTNALVEFDMTGSHADIKAANFKNSFTYSDENKSQGDVDMEKETITTKEMLSRLKNQVDAGLLEVSQLSSGLGVEVLNADKKADLLRLKQAEDKVGNITNFVNSFEETKKEAFSTLKENKLKATFKDEAIYEIAESLFMLKSGSSEDVDKEIERISKLKAITKLQGSIASSINHTPNSTDNSGTEEKSNEMEA